MNSSTWHVAGLLPEAVQRITSLSVITPTTCMSSWLSTTGTRDECSSSMARAALEIESWRVTTGGLSIIISLTFMGDPLYSCPLGLACGSILVFSVAPHGRYCANYIIGVMGGQP